MRFLIQTYNGIVKHDFSFTLMQSCEYQNWLHPGGKFKGEKQFEYDLTDEVIYINGSFKFKNSFWDLKYANIIPIGSVEFVTKYLNDLYNLNPKPKNVPIELFDYANRDIFNGNENDPSRFLRKGKLFVICYRNT